MMIPYGLAGAGVKMMRKEYGKDQEVYSFLIIFTVTPPDSYDSKNLEMEVTFQGLIVTCRKVTSRCQESLHFLLKVFQTLGDT